MRFNAGRRCVALVVAVFCGQADTRANANPNANGLRRGTLYSLRFDANALPLSTWVIPGLLKLGVPPAVAANSSGSTAGIVDCNLNGIEDECDVDCGSPGGPCDVPGCGESFDCNDNTIPDECETFPTTPLTTIRVANGLSDPVFVCAPPDDLDRLFIVEQPGRIKILDLLGGTVSGTPFLDITSLVGFGGERGLLSMAFHPDYGSNGYFFVNYTNNSGNTVIARYSVSGDPDVADSGSTVVLITITQDFSNHNGGQLQFGPDGYLYVGMGDGGSGGDPYNRAQDLDSLLGKMLRLDVDAGTPYIPPDNPFVGVTGLDEIWAYGLRNPWRFSFDRLTGDMYIADVGQNIIEEIDFQRANSAGGENYGWRCYEGSIPYDLTGCDDPGRLVFPILEYSHSNGCSVTGGYVYRGCTMPDLSGTYFYADYCDDWIKTFRYESGVVTDEQDRTAELTPDVGFIASISSFGEDAAGELYICDLNGEVFKIIPAVPECGNGSCEVGEDCANCPDDCGVCPPQYCASTYSNTTNDWITNVTFNTINNDSGQEGGASYGDYTSVSTEVVSGLTYTLTVTFYSQGTWTQHVRAWIDWNGNDDLTDPGESYYLGSGVDGTLSVGITVPVPAIPGITRMRIIEQYQTDPSSPCDPHSTIYGETEDYTVNLLISDAIRGGKLWDKWWVVSGAPEPTGDHPLYPPVGQQSGSATWRCKECHGWDYKGVDGEYGSGPHFTGIRGVFGSTMTPQEMFDIVELDNVPNGHGFGVGGSGLSDQDIRDLVTFMQTLVVDTDLYVDGDDGFLGDEVQGEVYYTGIGQCITCHGADGTLINLGTPEEPEWVGTHAVEHPREVLHKIRFGNPGTPMPSFLAGGGTDQGAADIGLYAQSSLPVECTEDGQCDDGKYCNGPETCVAGWCQSGTPPLCGDFDLDGNVDLDDFDEFDLCFTGLNGGPIDTGCEPGDFDGDNDIDCFDWEQFVLAWTEPGDPPELERCVPSIPTVSEWGLVVMTLLILAVGIVVHRRINVLQTTG